MENASKSFYAHNINCATLPHDYVGTKQYALVCKLNCFIDSGLRGCSIMKLNMHKQLLMAQTKLSLLLINILIQFSNEYFMTYWISSCSILTHIKNTVTQ